jgi:hypothetical protein
MTSGNVSFTAHVAKNADGSFELRDEADRALLLLTEEIAFGLLNLYALQDPAGFHSALESFFNRGK